MISASNDILFTTPAMIRDYWFLAFIFAGIIVIIEFLYRRIKAKFKYAPLNYFNYQKAVLYLFVILLFVIAARGGLQLKPIAIISSVQYTAPGLSPVILNTPFTIIKTITKDELKKVDFFSDEMVMKEYFSTKRNYGKNNFKEMNVVVIILESFSAEYSQLLSGNEGYTPFLDSLMLQSLYFTNAQANGKRSIEGIPAIVAGLPSLMTNPYISSAYAANRLHSLASHLKNKNYNSSFFHGGRNGTMGFDSFSIIAGIDNYFGMNEYGSDIGFDNNWGIYDEHFLQFTADKLIDIPQPFLGFIFTLSSHHPYSIPVKHKGKFKKGTLPIHESIMYADYSLKQFFSSIQNSSWFENTIFIITSDHTGPAEHHMYQTRLGFYRIPLFFYKTGSLLKGKMEKPVQHIDIMPAVLDYLNYDNEFYSFGKSIFNNEKNYIFNYINNVYQINDEQYILQFDGEEVLSLHDYINDPLLKTNLKNKFPQTELLLENTLKAVIQTYVSQMKSNKINKE
jgi:phosphoglycerol transferase MdoB-like AlkP superfamily enzyme